ncbi:MAG: hypothetical protein JJE36_04535 [Coriobacteriia bacterium]|nr:hypothetical protein [Coriobacteriia bacterium]
MQDFKKAVYWILILAIIAALLFLIWNIYLGFAGNDPGYFMNLFKK